MACAGGHAVPQLPKRHNCCCRVASVRITKLSINYLQIRQTEQACMHRRSELTAQVGGSCSGTAAMQERCSITGEMDAMLMCPGGDVAATQRAAATMPELMQRAFSHGGEVAQSCKQEQRRTVYWQSLSQQQQLAHRWRQPQVHRSRDLQVTVKCNDEAGHATALSQHEPHPRVTTDSPPVLITTQWHHILLPARGLRVRPQCHTSKEGSPR
jgi:hypothetical protein